MKTFLSTLALALLAGSAQAQCEIEIKRDRAPFPVIIEIDKGTADAQQRTYYGKNDSTFELKAGEHTFSVRSQHGGFIQPVTYTVSKGDKNEKTVYTTDPYSTHLARETKLEIWLHHPLEVFNSTIFTIKETKCCLVFQRPLWFEGIDKKWEGKEQYPNTILFFADEEWKAEKVYKDLAAEIVLRRVRKGLQGHFTGKCHVAVICALEADRTLPADIMNATQKQIEDALLEAHQRMLKTKCYSFSHVEAAALKKAGHLPDYDGEKGMNFPLFKGVQRAQESLKAWKAQPKE
jgi:hypothetical protein